jgi:hypothetical protein
VKGNPMIKINVATQFKGHPCPCVSYHHYMLKRPMKLFIYKRFPFINEKAIVIFAKLMAMLHDYILCTDSEIGIQYGIYYLKNK